MGLEVKRANKEESLHDLFSTFPSGKPLFTNPGAFFDTHAGYV